MLSPMALSWLSETEYLRLEALVEEAEWAASLNDRAAALPELPLDLDPFHSFLDVKVGGFIAPSSRGINSGFMKSKQPDKIFPRLRVAQQEVFEEAEFLHKFILVNMLKPNHLKHSDQVIINQLILIHRLCWS